MTYKIGFLDQSPLLEGFSIEEAFQETVTLAKLADNYGFSRFWVAEHHNSTELVGSSPEILITHLLANTKRIRIGSGGVMLQHYHPYKVAENFNVLTALYGDRVDLGIGNGPGGLVREGQVEDQSFNEKLLEVQLYTQLQTRESQTLKATPLAPNVPKLFLLGASRNSAHLANSAQLPYAFAQFFNETEEELREAAAIYNAYEQADKYFLVTVSVAIVENEVERLYYATPTTFVKAKFQNGKIITFKSEEQAEAFALKKGESFTLTKQTLAPIVGTVEQVKQRLDELAETYNINEFVIHLASTNKDVRRRTISKLAQLLPKVTV